MAEESYSKTAIWNFAGLIVLSATILVTAIILSPGFRQKISQPTVSQEKLPSNSASSDYQDLLSNLTETFTLFRKAVQSRDYVKLALLTQQGSLISTEDWKKILSSNERVSGKSCCMNELPEALKGAQILEVHVTRGTAEIETSVIVFRFSNLDGKWYFHEFN